MFDVQVCIFIGKFYFVDIATTAARCSTVVYFELDKLSKKFVYTTSHIVNISR